MISSVMSITSPTEYKEEYYSLDILENIRNQTVTVQLLLHIHEIVFVGNSGYRRIWQNTVKPDSCEIYRAGMTSTLGTQNHQV